MALHFLRESPDRIVNKLGKELAHIDPQINLSEYRAMTVHRLDREMERLREKMETAKTTSKYGSWLKDEGYIRDSILSEAIRLIAESKREAMRSERLIPGAVYYTGVSRFGRDVRGQRAIFEGQRFTGWMPFHEHAAVMKAREIMRHGDPKDFREIYVGMADGAPDALQEVSMEHITKSSKEALRMIERYCDSRWEGPWPWEIEAPERLKMMIEQREEKKMKDIREMQRGMQRLLREFEEGSMSEFEVVSAAQEMMGNVDSMISNLGKLSSSGIEVMASAKAAGNDTIAAPMQKALGEPLNAAVSALTDLKAALSSATSSIMGGEGGDLGMDDDMGSPMDAMGADPLGGDDSDDLTDIEIGGDDEERPVKEI